MSGLFILMNSLSLWKASFKTFHFPSTSTKPTTERGVESTTNFTPASFILSPPIPEITREGEIFRQALAREAA